MSFSLGSVSRDGQEIAQCSMVHHWHNSQTQSHFCLNESEKCQVPQRVLLNK